MIKGLKLKNWRTHYDSSLEFEKGTNLIIGIMGSGKSSVVNGLSYGLFGTFPQLKSKQLSINEVIMNKPNKQDHSEVCIDFIHNEKDYRIERILKESGTNEAKLYEENKLIAGPRQKDVNEKIEQILGLNYELFSRAVYAEQNEMDFFLKLSPSERKKKFDELLELEKYETVRKNSVVLKNQIEKENKQKKEFLLQQKDLIKQNEEEKILEDKKVLESEILELNESKEKLKNALDIARVEYNLIEEKQKKHLEIKIEIEKINSKISTLKKNLEKTISLDINKILNEKEEIEKLIKNNEEIKINIEKEMNLKEIEKNSISEKKSVLEYKLKEIKKEEIEINSLNKTCPTCKQELDETHKTRLINEINKNKLEITKQFEEIETNLKRINEEIKKLKTENELTKKTIDELIKKSFENKQKENEISQNQKMQTELNNSEKELKIKETELVKFNFNEKELKEKQEFFFEMKNSNTLIDEKIISKIKLKENLEFTLNKIIKIKNNLELIEKEILKNEQISKKLGVFENCLISTQSELREELLQTINLAMSSVWQQIYPYSDYLDVKLKVVENGYDLIVQTRNENWVRVEGILSGGERSAAALCIRIAFSLVLTKQLSILILDEPTHNLDKNSIEKLSIMLREDLPKLVEQIFVITHEKELENAASSKIYLLNRNKNIDEATKIEELSKK